MLRLASITTAWLVALVSVPVGAEPSEGRGEERAQHRQEQKAEVVVADPETGPEERRRRFRQLTAEKRRDARAKSPAPRGKAARRRVRIRDEALALPPRERRELIEKLQSIQELPKAEQRELRERYERLHGRSAEEREELREKRRRWNEMPPERRRRLRKLERRLRELPENERGILSEKLERARRRDGRPSD